MDSLWTDAFDRVVVVRHTAYRAERGAGLARELSRVGLADASVRWTFPSPFVARFANAVRFSEGVSNFDETVFGMYAELKTDLELGLDRVLVLEDDVRFLKDETLLRRLVGGIPGDFVDAKLSWIRRGGPVSAVELASKAGSSCWVPTTGVVTRDTGAVAFSREGMRWFTSCVEASLELGGPVLRSCDLYDRPPFYLEDGRRHYLAVPLAARQVQYGVRMSRIGLDRWYATNSCEASGGRAAYGG